VARFLSPDWLGEVSALGGQDAAFGDVSARVELVVSGGPDGDVKCVLVLDGGRIAETRPGAATDAELTMTLDYATAAEIQQGTLDPSVAFMQGRSKAAGDTGVLLQLLPVARTDAYRALRDKLNANTEF
jgi:putative sterol carrier protein